MSKNEPNITLKKGMTLKSVPISLKKVKKVVGEFAEQLKENETSITPAERFDLEVTGMYLRFLKDTVAGILEDSE